MRVLVTGGAGFIGATVVAELVPTAGRVVVLDSLRPDVHRDQGEAARRRLSAIGADLMVGDVRDAAVVSTALQGIDVVVHLAARVGLGIGIDDMAEYVSNNDYGSSAGSGPTRPAAQQSRCGFTTSTDRVCRATPLTPGWRRSSPPPWTVVRRHGCSKTAASVGTSST